MIAQPELPVSDASEVLGQFPGMVSPWPGSRWTWDMRFACAISVVRVSDWPAVESWLRCALPLRFESTDAGHLTARQRACIQRFGGVRGGQMGFAEFDRPTDQRFALIWPWSDGVHVSVRLAVG